MRFLLLRRSAHSILVGCLGVLALWAPLSSGSAWAQASLPLGAQSRSSASAPPSNLDQKLDAELDFLTTAMPEQVMVSVASKQAQSIAESPSVVSVLTHSELKVLGVRNLAEALNLIPGVTSRYNKTGQYDILVQGQKEAPDILVMIDGQRLNSVYDGSVLYDLRVDNVDRIEVIRGPGSALYGANAFVAVINVITFGHYEKNALGLDSRLWPSSARGPDQTRTGFEGFAKLGTQLKSWTVAAYLDGRSDPGAALAMPLDRNGLFDDGQLHLLNDQKRQLSLNLAVKKTGLFGEKDSLELRPKYLFHEQGPNFGYTETFAPHSRVTRKALLLPLDYHAELAAGLGFSTRISYDRQNVDDDVQIRPDLYHDRANLIPAPTGLRNQTAYAVNSFNVEPQLLWELPVTPLWQRHTLVVGLQGQLASVSNFHYGQNYADTNGVLQYYENFSPAREEQLQAAGVPTDGFQNYNGYKLKQRTAQRRLLAGFAQSQILMPANPLGRAWLTLGIRNDRISDARIGDDGQIAGYAEYTPLNPRGSLVLSPTLFGWVDGLSVKLIYGSAFRAPTFQELYDSTRRATEEFSQIPNELLEPQRTEIREVGVELAPLSFAGTVAGKLGHGWKSERLNQLLVARYNYFEVRTDKNLGLDVNFNPVGNQIINYPGRSVTGHELEVRLQYSAIDFAFFNYSTSRVRQVGDCLRYVNADKCYEGYGVLNNEISDVPRERANFGFNVRPVGAVLEVLGAKRARWSDVLNPLTVSMNYRMVGASKSNFRTVFESLTFPFSHPGYESIDLGLGYTFAGPKGTAVDVRVFAYNLLDEDVSEPIVIKLDPQPATGFFLPRPGRSFLATLELTF